MTPPRKLLSAVLISVVVVGCSSTSKTSTGADSTTTTSSTATTVAGDVTATTAASATTSPATTPATTKATTPATTPATTAAPQIITSFSVSEAAACTDPSAPYQPPPPSVTVSWTVVGADSVNLLIDGGLWSSYGLSGSETLPAACDATLHNTHTFSVVAIKGGQEIATKSKTRGY